MHRYVATTCVTFFTALPLLVGSTSSKQIPSALYTAAADGANFLQYNTVGNYKSSHVTADSHGLFRSSAPMLDDAPKTYSVTTLREMPHEGAPWTQGFEFDSSRGRLVETSGDYPPGSGSFVRFLDPATGKELNRFTAGLHKPPSTHRFIEGISAVGGRWFASTYQDRVALEYDADMNLVGEHSFPWDGWGLARSHTGNSLLATNSSEYIMNLDTTTFQASKTMVATCLGKRVAGLNELEMVDDFMGQGPRLLGNVINTRMIMVLDPETAKCSGSFTLDGASMEAQRTNEHFGFHVANGIAYNKATGNFFVTGKNWKSIFEVRLDEVSSAKEGAPHAAQLRNYLSTASPL